MTRRLRPLLMLVTLLLLCHSIPALASGLTGRDEQLEARILQAWQSRLSARYAAEGIPVPSTDGYTASWGCVIKRGGDTQELIDQKQHWELAIVSASDVDLQRLAEEGILYGYPRYFPEQATECHQWLHRDLWRLLPEDTTRRYNVYFYDRTGDGVTLLLCNGSTRKKRDGNAQDYALTLLSLRSPEAMRRTDGIAYLAYASPEELLSADPASWDAASVAMRKDDRLTALDEAGLLLDLRQEPYLAQRPPLTHDQRRKPDYIPAGMYASDGRMIALPYNADVLDRQGNAVSIHALIINPRSLLTDRSLAYAVHVIKSVEWRWGWQSQPQAAASPALDRSDMDW